MRVVMLTASLVAIIGVAHLRRGHAGGHGSGGHGGSRGSCGHASGHRGSHGPATCTEDSSVVGYRKCSTFGAWSSKPPALSFDLGVVGHRFIGERLDTAGTLLVDARGVGARAVGQPEDLVTTAVAPQLRIALRIGSAFYVANELEYGGVTSGPGARTEIDGTQARPVSTTYAAVRGVAGVSLRSDPVAVSAELAGGGRFLSSKIRDEPGRSLHSRGELQARARLDLWLSPRMTIGAMVGRSLVEHGDTIVAMSIGGHLRAFGEGR
jgi:hypothetical protein